MSVNTETSLCFVVLALVVLLSGTSATNVRVLKRGGKNVCTFYQTKTVYATVKDKVTTLHTVQCTVQGCYSYCFTTAKGARKPLLRGVHRGLEWIRMLQARPSLPNAQAQMFFCGVNVGAICNPQCQNNGVCIGPNRCKCRKGFEGRFCQLDVNECLTPEVTGCSQRCINLPGTYSCLCERGFVPGDPFSKTCKGGQPITMFTVTLWDSIEIRRTHVFSAEQDYANKFLPSRKL
eukprot:gene20113-22084_t